METIRNLFNDVLKLVKDLQNTQKELYEDLKNQKKAILTISKIQIAQSIVSILLGLAIIITNLKKF